ncbi:chemotaxis protein CheW [Chamaesiphon sp. OTE_8_metabat_110]|uniref:chemotaxis protein CheW n=1 Tax=Chamaesiphon sp. OTE_8_metabat_110 TaxID=2964696 RepID=UPI00286CC82D|nr:chemotaxis protein CheW [Chamaesiphon sp. OTE_8_metabat_110]
MSGKPHLIFALHGSLYGISADFVRQICSLPELHTLATAPADILGIFNWRSQMVPVMHLDLRFGRGFSGCSVSDRLIVVECQGIQMAIVAHEVFDVQTIDPQPLDTALIQARQAATDRHFISGIAQGLDAPITCLDLDRLIREPEAVAALDRQTSSPLIAGAGADFYSRCCPEASIADRATFATRARQLQTAIDLTQSSSDEQGVLVVQIGSEYLGLPLELVLDVDVLDRFSISPVPIAPEHILGQINWRSEIVPVLELSSILQMPPLPRQEVVVVEIDSLKMGIGVDRIFDVFYLTGDRIDALPISASDRSRQYLRGVSKYADGLMYLLDLRELVERKFLVASAV